MSENMIGQPPIAVMNNMVANDRIQAHIKSQATYIFATSEWGGKTIEVLSQPEYPPITAAMRELMVRELSSILSYYGFTAKLLAGGTLRITKGWFETMIEDAPALMPFGSHLPEQIKRAYHAFNYENNINDESDYCRYCNKQLSAFELHHNAVHNPDKQLCRPCLVYKQPESQLQKPPLTDEQKAENGRIFREMMERLKNSGEK